MKAEDNKQKVYLAIDIGASSGRHMAGYVEDGQIRYEEIYRFPNGYVIKDGYKCWDIEALKAHIIEGMKRCGEKFGAPVSVGIDTWAVDFVLIDGNGKILGNAVSYRDDRTKESQKKVYEIIDEESLYARTGIQKQIFNTIYQLMSVKLRHKEQLDNAAHFLMIPDYFNYILSGKISNEYTNATTTQLVNPDTMDWDYELIEKLGFKKSIFTKPVKSGTVLGELLPEIQSQVGYNCLVVAPATHDTGSAVAAVPYENGEEAVYISSGTWSLMGVEQEKARRDAESRIHNFTNEGGAFGKYRYLKNIMGLWMIQQVKKEEKDKYSFSELCDMASKSEIDSIVDCNDEAFLAPESMEKAITCYCSEHGLKAPENIGEMAAVIYNSLAMCYKEALEEIEELTGKHYDVIYVVGGGTKAEYLNRLTERYTGRKVKLGPSEATAIGNLKLQMIADKAFKI